MRRDDGVAHAVLDLLGPACGVESRALLQLTPEIAADIALSDVVVFMDADAEGQGVRLELLQEPPVVPVLTHISTPTDIVALSISLFGFTGRAFLCRIPVEDLAPGEGLSLRASAHAGHAAQKLKALFAELQRSG